MRSLLLTAVIVAATAVSLNAQTEKPASDAKQPAGLAAIAPLVNQDTFLVVYVNLSEKNVQSAAEKFDKITKPLFADERPGDKTTTKPATRGEQMKDMYAKFTKAGGKDLYVVANGPREGKNNPDEPVLVISLAADADIKALNQLLGAKDVDSATENDFGTFTKKVGNLLVLGRKTELKALGEFKPSDRPELAKAMAAIPDAAARVAYLPTPALRLLFAKNAATLPEQFGGSSTEPLVEGVQWATLGLTIQPDLALDLVVQAKDAKTAKDILAIFTQVVDSVQKITKEMPADGNGMKMGPMMLVNAATKILKPTVKDAQVLLHLDQKAIDAAVEKTVMPMMTNALQSARQASVMMTVNMLMKSCIMYQQNNNRWPDGFESLIKDGSITAKMLTNIRNPSLKLGFIYRKPADNAGVDTVVIYENYDNWPGSIAVGFADGHVQIVKDEQAFKKMLKGEAADTKEKNPDGKTSE